MVFNERTMEQYVPQEAMEVWRECLKQEKPLPLEAANDIADAMKNWALEHGATHFTHWFQPLTGVTAEKHEGFIKGIGGGRVIMDFSGKELVCGEPDASSFPSGGLRATFEARGYSAWDPTSFAFIKDGSLCIPTVFCSYGGEALDKKTPLLRSMEAVSREAVKILRLFGDEKVRKATPQIGAEQEYFLIDRSLYLQREDLRLCGRTLFGNKPPKGQELDDHYFGAIRPRVAAYMKDLDEELWKLGVLSKTKHNEVAPAQHEMAPIYTDANTANDQNQLVMETMKKVAERHGLVCLLHEKPFAGVNGSGKHINWSLSTDTGKNLFSPGKTPSQNAQFLLFLAAFVKGADEYQELLRCSVAFAGNDHRLGAQEAPPAIISIFLGDELEEIVDSIISQNSYAGTEHRALRIGVDVLPSIPQDTTDRNRTSPLAFTGNKFEFRAPGSAQSCAGPMMTLNTIVAEAFDSLAEELSSFAPETFLAQLQETLKRRISEHKRIIFNGDNYSEEWVKEAERRGLPNLKNTMTALHTLVNEKNVALFEKYGVFSRRELESRFEIFLEEYHRRIRIEGRLSWEMAATIILPALRNEYKQTVSALSRALDAKRTNGTAALQKLADKLGDALDSVVSDLDTLETALTSCHEDILAAMSRLRTSVDAAETLVNDRSWPLPKYREMLFIY